MLGITRVNSGGLPQGEITYLAVDVNTPQGDWQKGMTTSDIIATKVGKTITISGKGKVANGWAADLGFGYLIMKNPLKFSAGMSNSPTGDLYAIDDTNERVVDLIDGEINASQESDMTAYFTGYGSARSAPGSINLKLKGNMTTIGQCFQGCYSLQGRLALDINPVKYSWCFERVGESGDGLIVDYTAKCTKIDQIIATKAGGKVFKGTLI